MSYDKYMAIAVDLAKMTINQTAPNPSVGAVIVKNDKIIGIGSHLLAGSPHAEIYAINMHKEKCAGATLFVTLEPCCHFGKTPPCTDAIIEAKIAKVVVASLDPNPLVGGKGVAILKNAGIEVVVGVREEESRALNRKYFYYISNQLPFITLKVAMSLDAKLSTVTGESKWITGQEARMDGHFYRTCHEAILVGINTILADDPSLTSHYVENGKNPVRIILDSSLRTPITAKVISYRCSPTWIVVNGDVGNEQIDKFKQFSHVKILPIGPKRLDVVLAKLYELGITSILVEGGATVHSQFLEQKLVNQIVAYIAPKLIGGAGAKQFFAANGFMNLREALNLEVESFTKIGDDIKIVANFARS